MSDFRLSQYARVFRYEDAVLLYNTVNCVCVVVPAEVVHEDNCVYTQDAKVLDFLRENKFFVNQVNLKKEAQRYVASNILHLSLETSLACNFSCPYCYQKNNEYEKTFIKSECLDSLFTYIERVYELAHIDILNLKILGGEPSITWDKVISFLSGVYEFCRLRNIRFNLKVDTNGYFVEPFLSCESYDTILFTVPLCYKDIHNQYRRLNDGTKTYDQIVDNVNKLSSLRHSSIVIRHNTDAQNIGFFGEFLSDLRERLCFAPNINPQYTTNPLLGDYKNRLSRPEFVHWLSTICIDELLAKGFGVFVSPLRIGACMYNSTYSMKLFSSGKVGACARFFYNFSNPHISCINAEKELTKNSTYWGNAKKFSPFESSKCLKCSMLFSCGGHYYLPCILDYSLSKCEPEKSLYLDYGEYFGRLYDAFKNGNARLFRNIQFYDMCSLYNILENNHVS